VIGLSALLIAGGFGPRWSQKKVHREGNEAYESGRGRSANTPSEIPAPGWKDILLRVYRGISEHRILLVAAGVTFYGLLAIFPGIAALVSIYGLFADPASMTNHLDTIASVAPGGAIEVLRDQLTRLASQGGTTLGISFLLSLLISLWTANSGVKAVFDALNIVYEEQEKRWFITLNAVTLAITILAVGLILISLGVVVALPVVLNYLPIAELTDALVKLARWPLLFAVVTVALAVLYRYGPSRTKPRWRWIT
jgi:membrane protein